MAQFGSWLRMMFGSVVVQLGSMLVMLVQFGFRFGSVLAQCWLWWISVGSGLVQFGSGWFRVGPVLVQSWFSVDPVWFSSGSVLGQVGSLWVMLAQFWFSFGSALVQLRFRFGSPEAGRSIFMCVIPPPGPGSCAGTQCDDILQLRPQAKCSLHKLYTPNM